MLPGSNVQRGLAGSRLRLLLAFAILLSSLAWIATPQGTDAATVGTDVLRLRSGPGTDYDILTRMYQGESIEIIEGPSDGWYKVNYNGTVGWASADYVSTGGGGSGSASIGTDVLNLRTGPGTGFAVITRMYQGEGVDVLDGPSDGWYKLDYNGSVGWASGDYLDFGGGGSNSGSDSPSGTAWVNTDGLRVRGSASLDGPVWDRFNTGHEIWLLGTAKSGFWAISYDGGTAWVYADYITFDEPASGGGGNSFWVPAKYQERNLSCEYASLEIATTALGSGIWEGNFIDVVGYSANPHYGFRGDIDGYWGGTSDYGVYPEALRDGLAYYGFTGSVFYGGQGTLQYYLDLGMPTLVWIDLWYNSSFVADINGDYVTLAPGIHVVVAYGYDSGGVYVSDPARGAKRLIPWGDFLAMWGSVDQMALAVGY